MTSISRVTHSSVCVAAARLCDTAVTPSDRSIEYATISEYDGSLPTSVMSVPCRVVTTRPAGLCPPDSSTCFDSSAAVACGMA